MMMFRRKRETRCWQVYTDGAIRPEMGLSGLSVVVYDESGAIALWWYRVAGAMTCNEAEYAAAIFALDQLMAFRPLILTLYSDSQVMVSQMRGEARVRSPELRKLHLALCQRAIQFEKLTFLHIEREQNRVADALAYEAIAQEIKTKGGQDQTCAKILPSHILISGQ